MIVELQWSPPDAPCCVKLVPIGRYHYKSWDSFDKKWVNLEDPTVLIQTDWDWPALAGRIGWQLPCRCGHSDGTVDCDLCQVTAHEMIMSSGEFLRKNSGRRFRRLDDYFT